MINKSGATKPAAKPSVVRRTMEPPSAGASGAKAASAKPVAGRRTLGGPAAAPAPRATSSGGGGGGSSAPRTKSAGGKASSPASRGVAPPGPLVLGSLQERPAPSPSRSALEQIAEHYDSRPASARRDGDNNKNDGDTDSVARHADLDDMSPENASFKDLVAMRERQHVRVRDVLLKYNSDLQQRLDGSRERAASLSPRAADGTTAAHSPVAQVTTADEARIIEELLAEEEGNSQDEPMSSSPGAAAAARGAGGAGAGDVVAADGSQPITPRSAGVGGVSRTALRAIIKHAQDTVNNAIAADRDRQADFEAAVFGRLAAMERASAELQASLRSQAATTAEAEEQDRSVRASDIEPLRKRLVELAEWRADKEDRDADASAAAAQRVDVVAADLGRVVAQIQAHQADLDGRTRAAAEECTRSAVDAAAARVRDLCEKVHQDLAQSAQSRDDIPQALALGVANIDEELKQAMQAEFGHQMQVIATATAEQAAAAAADRTHMTTSLEAMQGAVGQSLDEMRSKYDGAVAEHVGAVRAKAEEYEEARRLALPVPDADRVALMKEELENSLRMLKFLTEASSNAMSSTIPPRLERNEQRTAQLEAVIEAQQQEIDRLRCSNLRYDVAVGPDTLKDAWLGVSSYRAPPPVSSRRGARSVSASAGAGGGGDDGSAAAEATGGNDGEQQQQQQGGGDEDESMQDVHDQISEALRMIARRNTGSMSPMRSQSSTMLSGGGGGGGGGGANAGAAASAATTSPDQQQHQYYSGRGAAAIAGGSPTGNALPDNFAFLTPREQMDALTASLSSKRAQLVAVQRALTNIQRAFQELTATEDEALAATAASDSFGGAAAGGAAGGGGDAGGRSATTPRTVAEYRTNRKLFDEIAAKKQLMYDRERLIIEKRNRLSREIEAMQGQEEDVLRSLTARAGGGRAVHL